MKKEKCCRLGLIGLFQGLGVVAYCSLVAILFWQGNNLFGHVPNYFGPLLFLLLFSTSAMICALITLYYPFILFFKKKETNQAIKLVLFTAGWLLVFTSFILMSIFLSK